MSTTMDYQIYIDKLSELRRNEEAQLQIAGKLKNSRPGLFSSKSKQKQQLEEAEAKLRAIREEAERICGMLDELREKKEERVVMQNTAHLWDENPQIYNEVIGVCYRKAILWADDGRLYWFGCPDEGAVAIGDCEPDDGLLRPLSVLPIGEQKMILSYLIEAGSTPIHYLDFLKEELK